MNAKKIIHVVSCHAEGEVGDVIVGGVSPPPGESIWEQSRWIAKDQKLRNLLLNEPRGGVFRHINLLVPPKDPRAQMGWIIMEPEDTPPRTGSSRLPLEARPMNAVIEVATPEIERTPLGTSWTNTPG